MGSPVAFLFPGQGSQAVGMLASVKDLPAVKAMLSTAQRILGYDIMKICLEGKQGASADAIPLADAILRRPEVYA
jgi:[acyl-carrier-protein] S-malonyltransferase